jgi:hypothetical protein
MPDPSWPSLTPEVNYLRLVGPGAAGTATTIANVTAWHTLTASNEAAFAQSTLNTAVTAANFEGVGAASSVATISDLNAALQLLTGWVQAKPSVAISAIAAYETAVSSMIPAQICMANRAEQAANVAANPAVLGALTPAIVALDAEYFGEHWPHNAGVGVAYGAALAALVAALAIPPPVAAPGSAASAPVTAAAEVAQAAGRALAGEVMKGSGELAKSVGNGTAVPTEAVGQAGTMMQPVQAALGSIQPLMGMFQTPIQGMQTLAGPLQSIPGALRAMPSGPDGDEYESASTALSGASTPVGDHNAGVARGNAGYGSAAGLPGPGITSYSRPASSFAPETAGQPAGLKTGLLSAADGRGAAAAGAGNGALPMSPAASGMLARGRDSGGQDGGPRARIVAQVQAHPERPI